MTDQQTGWRAPETEPGPAPGVEFAGYGARILGYIIDGIILTIIVGIIWLIATALLIGGTSVSFDASGQITSGSVSGAGVSAVILAVVATMVVTLLYFPWFWARDGQTPGQKLTGIKVVRDSDGGPISWGSAFLRLVGYWVSGLFFYLGYIWVLIDKRRRGWFDLMGGTVVIKAR